MTDADNRELIIRYMALDVDLLYGLIPIELEEYTDTRFSPEGQADAGRRFFVRITRQLQDALCPKWAEWRVNPEMQDSVNLVAAIADIISSLFVGVPPFVVASIIVKLGLGRFCSNVANQDNDSTS